MAWKLIHYRDGWFPKGNDCVLTNAEAGGRWKGEKYAIFDLDDHPHIAFWPMKPFIKRERFLSKEEALEIMRKATNGESLRDDFEKEYGNTKDQRPKFVSIETDELPF